MCFPEGQPNLSDAVLWSLSDQYCISQYYTHTRSLILLLNPVKPSSHCRTFKVLLCSSHHTACCLVFESLAVVQTTRLTDDGGGVTHTTWSYRSSFEAWTTEDVRRIGSGLSHMSNAAGDSPLRRVHNITEVSGTCLIPAVVITCFGLQHIYTVLITRSSLDFVVGDLYTNGSAFSSWDIFSSFSSLCACPM